MITGAIIIFLTVLAAFLVLIYWDTQDAPATEPDYIIGTPWEDEQIGGSE